jgi:hypothetical protein
MYDKQSFAAREFSERLSGMSDALENWLDLIIQLSQYISPTKS